MKVSGVKKKQSYKRKLALLWLRGRFITSRTINNFKVSLHKLGSKYYAVWYKQQQNYNIIDRVIPINHKMVFELFEIAE
jgi:hypothetical protein